MQLPFVEESSGAIPIITITPEAFGDWSAAQRAETSRWLVSTGFKAEVGRHALIPDEAGGLEQVLVVVPPTIDPWALAALPMTLPEGAYRIEGPDPAEELALGWGLGAYQFDRYRSASRTPAQLVVDASWNTDAIAARVQAICRGRDLINTGPEDLMPVHLAEVFEELAARFDGEFHQVVGDDLLAQNFPMVHAVGRASRHSPRLLRLSWGSSDAPRVALVGKGVCFDSGGLDLKPASGMRMMKKDMGGAAVAIAVAEMVMATALPVRLDLIVSAVENAVSDSAFHPGDVLSTRKGMTVEIDNTDAEGRLILGDALTLATERENALILDFATLTGAARVAMGTEVPAFFTDDEAVAAALLSAGIATSEPLWRLPLHRPYRAMLDSKVADIVNGASQPFGGAITAALFLNEFVGPDVQWAHFDLMGFNNRSRPGRPEGGEPQAALAVERYLRDRFS